MDETDRKDVRHCSACNKHVYYTVNVEVARRHVEAGACVVVDILSRRAPGDLQPVPRPIRMAGAMAPPPLAPALTNPVPPRTRPVVHLLFEGERIAVAKDHFVIGNTTGDLVIDSADISQPHAAVIRRNGTYYLKDLGSRVGIEYRGMMIDNKRIDEGDVFFLGPHELRFTYRP